MAISTNTPTPRRRSRSLTHEVVADLTQQIRDGKLKLGDKLPTETVMMTEQGVSRTVVREAISRLQAAGLVETRHGVGTFVIDTPNNSGLRIDPVTIVTLKDIQAILELRISLEVEAAYLAAQRYKPEHLERMRQALETLKSTSNRNSNSVAADFQFHQAIAEATDNRYFIDILTHLGVSIIPRTRIDSAQLADYDQSDYIARVNHEHQQIFDAISRHDALAARAAMQLHLTNSRERLQRLHAHIEQEQAKNPA